MDAGGVRVASGGQMAGLLCGCGFPATLQVLETTTSTKWKPRA